MQHLINKVSKANNNSRWETNDLYWEKDFDLLVNRGVKSRFLNKITQILNYYKSTTTKRISNSTTLVIDSHFHQVGFDNIFRLSSTIIGIYSAYS